MIQGGLIGKLVKRFGELPLVMFGALCFAISLFAVPFVGPAVGGLAGLLIGGGVFSMGNSTCHTSADKSCVKECWPRRTRNSPGCYTVGGESRTSGWTIIGCFVD